MHSACGRFRPAATIRRLDRPETDALSTAPGAATHLDRQHVRNSIAAGRRLAARVLVIQACISLAAAMLFLLQGLPSALAALCGGALVVIGNALLALRMFGATQAGGEFALSRLIAGAILKWFVVIGGIYLVIGQFRLPPLPALCGLSAALLANLAGFRFKDN